MPDGIRGWIVRTEVGVDSDITNSTITTTGRAACRMMCTRRTCRDRFVPDTSRVANARASPRENFPASLLSGKDASLELHGNRSMDISRTSRTVPCPERIRSTSRHAAARHSTSAIDRIEYSLTVQPTKDVGADSVPSFKNERTMPGHHCNEDHRYMISKARGVLQGTTGKWSLQRAMQ